MSPFPALLGLALHVGGVPTQADFQTPRDVGEVADQSYLVTWEDGDIDPTGKFNFAYQPANVPPNTPTGSPWFAGTSIANAQNILIMDPTNEFLWDTSAIPAGTYFIYEITDDEGVPPIHSVSPGPVTIQHPGDPLFPAVVVDDPDGIDDTTSDYFAVRWHASGAGPLTATISYAASEPNGVAPPMPVPLTVIETGVPMMEVAPGRYAGCYSWDLRQVPEGFYFVFVEAKDEAGSSHGAYGKSLVVVRRGGLVPDGGPASMCQAGPGTPDAGNINPGVDAGVDPPSDPPCGCRAAAGTTSATTATGALWICLALGGAAFARRTRRARARG